MKFIALLFLIAASSSSVFAQIAQSRLSPAYSAVSINDEEKEFARAIALDAPEKTAALQKFVENFLKSKKKDRNTELLVRARAILADEMLRSNDTAGAFALYKLAFADAPPSVSDELFNEVLIKIPNNLNAVKDKNAAVEAARLIEKKTVGNAKQTIALADFYLKIENADEAIRLANQIIQIQPEMSAAYQVLGKAYQMNFDVAGAANLFTKALRLDDSSMETKQRLADMKRALGRTAQSLTLYGEILAKNETDAAARNGLIIALLDAGERAQAETELQTSLSQNPKNLPLLVGAAYWFAARGEAARAIDLANKALAVEPKNVWAQIALGRGLMLQKRPLEAEKILLALREQTNLATVEYELAAARFQAGLYRESAAGLAKNFTVKDGLIETKLGGRVTIEERNFTDLLNAERQAELFQFTSADKTADAEKMKNFLELYSELQIEKDEAALAAEIDEFVNGDNQSKSRRQQFVTEILVNKKSAPQNTQAVAAVENKKKTTMAKVRKTETSSLKTKIPKEKTVEKIENKPAKIKVKKEEAAAKAVTVKSKEEKLTNKVESESKKFSTCKLIVSRENAVIGTAGGNFGVLLKFEGALGLPEIKAVSSSPSDIEAVFDSEVTSLSNRAFYLIKSNSQKSGVFTVLFETSCGRKEVSVTVL